MPDVRVPLSGTPISDGESFGSEHNDIFYEAIQRSRMPMLLTDPHQPDNPIVFYNASFLSLTGYEHDDVIGRNCRMLQGAETDPRVIDYVRDCVAKETDCAVEVLNYRKDGSSFWNGLYISPVYNNDGKLIYFFASQLDITRRVKSEEMLRQTQKLETLGQLTGGIAHDFNNMLTVVTGNLKMVQTGLERGADVSMYIERALSAARNSDKLTQQLLSFARKQRMEKEKVSLNQLVSHVQTLLERVVTPDVIVSVDLAPEPVTVMIDRAQAESALLNVLLNARDALPKNGGFIKMRTRHVAVVEGIDGPAVMLTVEDNGHGMDAETKERVFEPFFTTKPVGQGTGMGMAMVHGFVDQSGATVQINSVKGKGTSISIFFPAMHDEVVNSSPINSTRVLIVEDNHTVRDTTVDYLRLNGFTVRHAESGAGGLEVIESGFVPDVVFSDIVMPGSLNGLQAARLIRERHPGIKILLTSGWSNDVEVGEEFELLPKPYNLDNVAELLGSMSNLGGSRHEE